VSKTTKRAYYFGGWSTGGAFAYVLAQLVLAAGEEVEYLVLIDALCPVGLGKLPKFSSTTGRLSINLVELFKTGRCLRGLWIISRW